MELDDPSSALLVLPGSREGRDPGRSLPRGPRRTPPEVVAATQRDRLLDGFVRTVAEAGYTHARVSDICRAAGVTRPVFYELFEGKEDAFLAAYRHGTALVLQAMEEAYGRAAGWPAGVRAALGALLRILAEAPAFATMAVVEVDAVGPAGRTERQALLARFRGFFADAPATLPPGLGRELVDHVIGGVHSALYRRIAQGEAAGLPLLLPGLTFFTLAPFLGPGRARELLDAPPPADPPLPSCLAPQP
jgi:AcrR family transcriptional regulator